PGVFASSGRHPRFSRDWSSDVCSSDLSPIDPGVTLHLHATDELGTAGEWLIHGPPDGVRWEHGHGKGTAAARGRAADLLLTLVRDRKSVVQGKSGTRGRHRRAVKTTVH